MNNSNINNLVVYLRLTPYQSQMLEHNIDKYNVGRVVKRGGVLYVPYMSRGILGWIKSIFLGVQADLIGPNKVLVRNRRNIRFFKNGYHCVKIGPYTYYADAMGHGISRDEFLREIAD